MDTLLAIDTSLFLFINHLPHTPVLDSLGLLVSGVGTFGIIWLIVGGWLIVREERKDHRFWIPLFLTAFAGWFFAEIVFKNIFMRGRPASDMGAIIVGLNCCGYAFPSGHATIAFAMAEVLSHKEPKGRFWFFVLAVAVAFSRLYLGKHYPLDVLVGALLGLGIGRMVLALVHYFHSGKKSFRR